MLAKAVGRLSVPIREITRSDDPDISDFCDIRERDLVLQNDKLIIEGKVVLQHLLNQTPKSASIHLRKILVLENRFEGLLPLLEAVPETADIFVAKRDIMDAIAGFPIHRGLLALAEYCDPFKQCDLGSMPTWLGHLPQQALILVLSKISNHDNVGAIFRNAAAFGADYIILDEQCCHPFYRKSIRVSVGAALTVPFTFGVNIEDAFSALSAYNFEIYGLTPSSGQSLSKLQPSEKCALVLGTEGDGLSPAYLERLIKLKIEQTDAIDSLNVGTASGLALWHISTKLNRL